MVQRARRPAGTGGSIGSAVEETGYASDAGLSGVDTLGLALSTALVTAVRRGCRMRERVVSSSPSASSRPARMARTTLIHLFRAASTSERVTPSAAAAASMACCCCLNAAG